MKISAIIAVLEQWTPLVYAEDFDNVGLLVGNKNSECEGVLVSHDVSEAVIEEAVQKNCQLVVCFHPIIFKGLTSITGKNYVERTVIKAIENKVAIYAIHTALDNYKEGISYQLGKCLGLNNQRILLPQKNTLLHLTTYVPAEEKEMVLAALHEAGAGSTGEYSHCSFSVSGEGRFTPSAHSNPQKGEKEKKARVKEEALSVVLYKHQKNGVLSALENHHPYESVAYELVELENKQAEIGLGSIGKLKAPLSETAFMKHIKKVLNVPHLRHSALLNKEIQTVAVLGGSGAFCIDAAKAQGADALVTADLKYHDFFKAEDNFFLVDAGHYETEHFTKNLIHGYLSKKIANFAFNLSETNTNPVQYF